jgi:hypothetical protein
MNLSYSPSSQSPHSQQSPPGLNAGSPPNPSQGWNSMNGGGGGGGGGSFNPMAQMTPAAILQQQAAAKMGSPSPGPSGGGNTIDPNMLNWQDLTT